MTKRQLLTRNPAIGGTIDPDVYSALLVMAEEIDRPIIYVLRRLLRSHPEIVARLT